LIEHRVGRIHRDNGIAVIVVAATIVIMCAARNVAPSRRAMRRDSGLLLPSTIAR
jgi:hypothetical protein